MARLRGGRIGSTAGEDLGENRNTPDLQQILDRLNEQEVIIQGLREDLRVVQERQNEDRNNNVGRAEEQPQPKPPPPPQQTPGPMHYLIIQFCKHQPPVFRGSFDLEVAENWMSRMEKIFRVMECPTEKKAQMAIYMLEGDADRWWNNMELTLRARNIPITWESFKEKFNEEYFPRSAMLAKESEFLHIQQGNEETFNDYLTRFNRLSHYCMYMRSYVDEKWKSNWLRRGLKYEMKEKLVSAQFQEFNLAVEECRMAERNLRELRLTKDVLNRSESSRGNSSKKRKGQGFKPQGNNKRLSQSESHVYERPLEPQPCPQCGKSHPGSNCDGQFVCYKCHKPGHISRDCPSYC